MRCARLMLTVVLGPLLVAELQAQPVARLRGVVFDSVAAAPLAYAAVRVFRSDNVAEGVDLRTDTAGRFVLPGVRPGTWLVSFLHPRLDSLRLDAPVARVEVVEAGDIDVTLAVPSGASLARALCGARPDDSTAAVVGDVRDAATRRALSGATVRATWPEWVFAKMQMERENVTRVARTDSTGQFVLCGVPQGTTVTADAFVGADTTGMIELAVPTVEYVVRDFVLDVSSASGGARGVETSWKRGSGAVRGVVRTAEGKPFVNASARVLGSGSMVRSDSAGVFRIVDALAGTQTVEVRAVGFDPQRASVVLRPGEPTVMSFTLGASTYALDTVRVVAGRNLPKQVERIEERWRRGVGVIMDAETIRQRTSTTLTSALWSVPGIRLVPRTGTGNSLLMRGQSGRECRPTIFLDGYRISIDAAFKTVLNPNLSGSGELTIDEIVAPGDVLALEVYDNPRSVPAEYFAGGDCGVVLVWTGYALGKVVPLDPRKRR